jgi:hypothetical protein
MSTDSFADKIRKEMVADYSDALEKNFEKVKQFIKLTDNGKVDIINKEKVKGKDRILLYFIGKLYSKRAGFTDTENVTNKELLDELGIPEGSLRPWLKSLREEKKIKQMKPNTHSILLNVVERTINSMVKDRKE